jgi:hypothetical protein
MSIMMSPTYRTPLAASLVVASLAATAPAQDLYKSHAEMISASALSKQADAKMVEAMAAYGKAQAEVAKLLQEIREKAAHNDLLEAETYYKKRAQYHAYQSTKREKPVSAETYAKIARKSAPAELVSYHYNRESGDLRWPTLLKGATYDALRRRIDGLLEHRTREDSGAGSENCSQVLAVLDALKTALRNNIRRYTSTDYRAARNFLAGVALEVKRPVSRRDAETLDRVADR